MWAFGLRLRRKISNDATVLFYLLEMNDQSPLGSAASYGVPLPIDRALTAKLLGFSRGDTQCAVCKQ